MENQELNRLSEAIEYLKDLKLIENQKDIAKDLGYKREGTISEIVKGKVALTEKFINSFCSYYGISLEFIKNGVGEVFKNGSNVEQSTMYRDLKMKKDLRRQLNEIHQSTNVASKKYSLNEIGELLEIMHTNLIETRHGVEMNQALAKAGLYQSAKLELIGTKPGQWTKKDHQSIVRDLDALTAKIFEGIGS